MPRDCEVTWEIELAFSEEKQCWTFRFHICNNVGEGKQGLLGEVWGRRSIDTKNKGLNISCDKHETQDSRISGVEILINSSQVRRKQKLCRQFFANQNSCLRYCEVALGTEVATLFEHGGPIIAHLRIAILCSKN